MITMIKDEYRYSEITEKIIAFAMEVHKRWVVNKKFKQQFQRPKG